MISLLKWLPNIGLECCVPNPKQAVMFLIEKKKACVRYALFRYESWCLRLPLAMNSMLMNNYVY